MIRMAFAGSGRPLKRVLCLGAHSDDIEIGCGGSILRWLDEFEDLEVFWVVFSANPERRAEAEASSREFLKKAARKEVRVEGFKDGFFPYIGAPIKEYFERLKRDVSPDVIFAPHRGDFHQDHRLISELTWNTFRDHFILEYEIVKYDGDLGRPNFFIALDEAICRKKIDIILRSFKSQSGRKWFTRDAFMSIMRLRGVEIHADGNHAEAFYASKVSF